MLGTTVHGLLESDGLRTALLGWAARRAGEPAPSASPLVFAEARSSRLDGIADALEEHLDIERLLAIVAQGAPGQEVA